LVVIRIDFSQLTKERFHAAVASGLLDTCAVIDPEEVSLFLRLGPGKRLGAGECSAIALAINRRYPIAIDDNRAIKQAVRAIGAKLEVIKTTDVMVRSYSSRRSRYYGCRPNQRRMGASSSVQDQSDFFS
jgi:predicted nucleic acid-binding protein